jgi:hypothetical protein
VPVGLDCKPGECGLVEDQYLLLGSVLSLLCLLLWKFDEIEVQAESG